VTTQQIVSQDELNRIAQEAMAGPVTEVETLVPPNPIVTLPGGYIESDGALVKTVEVRELTGEDEEFIAKSDTGSKALNSMLMRGTVAIGDRPVEREDFDKLLSGDRDSILIGIRCVTFGSEVTYRATCSSCSTNQDLDIDLEKDLEYRELENGIKDRSWDITLKNGDIANVSLPNGKTQKKLLDASDDITMAELNTIFLTGCLNSINGSPARPTTALKLSLGNRETILKEVSARNPGPRLSEVSKACQACGELVPTPLSLGALFRF